jgi:hypothetical protein
MFINRSHPNIKMTLHPFKQQKKYITPPIAPP